MPARRRASLIRSALSISTEMISDEGKREGGRRLGVHRPPFGPGGGQGLGAELLPAVGDLLVVDTALTALKRGVDALAKRLGCAPQPRGELVLAACGGDAGEALQAVEVELGVAPLEPDLQPAGVRRCRLVDAAQHEGGEA